MLILRVYTTVLALTQLISFTTGTCDVPAEWQQSTWFSHYDNSLTWVVNYSGTVYLYSVTNIREVVTAGFSCLHSEGGDSGHHHLLLQNDRRRYCLRVVRAAPALLVLLSHVPSSVTDAGQCTGRLQDSEISWQVGYPVSGSRERCAFSSGGVYQAVVTKDGQSLCEQDAASVVTVDGSGELLINSCRHTNTYGYPLRGARLQCVAHASGTGGLGGGDPLLLLAYDDGQVTRFYCARYAVTGSRVHLSLDTANPDTASCRQGMAATTSHQGHLALTLTSVSTSPCGCVYGQCMDEPGGGQRCLCQAGYTGIHCQTELARGRCELNGSPCENGALCTDIDPAFYYCGCKYGFTGLHCEAIQTCQPNPCAHGGECVPQGAGFQCMCRSPYRGPRCEAGGDDPVALTGSSGPSTLVIVLVTLSGGVLVAALAIGVVMCQRRLKKKEESLPENMDGELPKQSSSMQAWKPGYRDAYSDQTGPAAPEPKDLDD